jgi:hypothetical protein
MPLGWVRARRGEAGACRRVVILLDWHGCWVSRWRDSRRIAKSGKQRAKSKEQKAEGRKQKAKGKRQRAKSRKHRAESKEQRARRRRWNVETRYRTARSETCVLRRCDPPGRSPASKQNGRPGGRPFGDVAVEEARSGEHVALLAVVEDGAGRVAYWSGAASTDGR